MILELSVVQGLLPRHYFSTPQTKLCSFAVENHHFAL